MRILVFSERLAPPPDEGIKKLTLSLAAALRELGHDVLTLTTGGADWPEMAVSDVPADRLLRSRVLADRIKAHRPEAVLYVPTASLTLAAGLRGRMLKGHAGRCTHRAGRDAGPAAWPAGPAGSPARRARSVRGAIAGHAGPGPGTGMAGRSAAAGRGHRDVPSGIAGRKAPPAGKVWAAG